MSSTGRRSSSVSSASSSGNSTNAKSNKSSVNGIKKKFACTHDGCGKSFSRSEHLHRHALNHKDGNNTCLRCSAHFRRRDLLDRHMARHKEKDDEAGGEGLGFLATRKRLWRDSDGNIVNCRRPYSQEHHIKRRQVCASPEAAMRRKSSTGSKAEKQDAIVAPLSPPMSIPSTASASGAVTYNHSEHGHDGIGGSSDGILDDGPMLHEAWNVDPMLSATSTAVDDFDFLCNSGWGNQARSTSFEPFMGAGNDLPYDDLFRPDTAMSFNAPFTTANYYSWLFDKDTSQMVAPTNIPQQPQELSTGPSSCRSVSLNENNNYPNNMPMTPNHNVPGEDIDLLTGDLESPSAEVPAILASMHTQTEPSGLFKQPEIGFSSSHIYQTSNGYHSTVSAQSSRGITLTAQQSHFNNEDLNYEAPTIHMPLVSKKASETTDKYQVQTPASHNKPPPDAHPSKESTGFPTITKEARDELMHLISQSCPCKPNGSLITASDPLLAITSLQNYSDLFFTRFNSPYPLIHQATFEPSNVHPFLLMAILLLGATYSDKESHLLAVCIHDVMRPQIHSSKDFSPNPKLWMLQTILLVECFGKSRAGEKQHDMSHLYHGLLINLIRRSDCQSACIPPFDEEIHDLEDYWREAVVAEQKRRLAMLCFMWDTQHAVLFSQSLCMNASELKLSLPWDPAIWEAATAQEWHHLTRKSATSPPHYLTVLKSYTNPNAPNASILSSLKNLNALSRVLILHGLMSLAWDLNRRDQTSLGLSNLKSSNTNTANIDVESEENSTWKSRISYSYDVWKSDFETYTKSVLSALAPFPHRRAKFQRFSVANLAIYHTAQMILAVDIIDLQIYAGAKHIIGRGVTDSDKERSRRRIGRWIGIDSNSNSERGGDKGGRRKSAKAVWHAARLFRDGVTKLEEWDVDEMFHYPWCLYLSALMCWVFHEAAVGRIYNSSNSLRDSARAANSALSEGVEMALPGTRGHVGKANGNGGYDEDADWDARVEMSALISGLTRFSSNTVDGFGEQDWEIQIWEAASKLGTAGLLRCMVKQLNTVRWAVVREGMIVLRGLVEGC